MKNLLKFPHLQQDQKVNVLNQYILHKLTYPLQTAPLNKVLKKYLKLLDITIRFNYANLAGVPGTSKANRRCRRCGTNETETPAHVLGKCPFGLNRRIALHHALKHRLADLLLEKGYFIVDEAQCEDEAGSTRYIDILAFDTKSNKAFLIDATIRFETSSDVDAEAIGKSLIDLFYTFDLDTKIIPDLSLNTITASLRIIRHNIYAK